VEGIVTVEDLVEELVGEIYDETDADLISVRHRDDGSLVVPGGFPAHDLPDLGVDVPKGDHTTVAGLVLAELTRLPKEAGDVVIVGRWRFRVTGVEGNRITYVTIDPAPKER